MKRGRGKRNRVLLRGMGDRNVSGVIEELDEMRLQ